MQSDASGLQLVQTDVVHVSRIELQTEGRGARSGQASFVGAGQVVQTGRFDLVDRGVNAVDGGDATHVQQGAGIRVDGIQVCSLALDGHGCCLME
ncbi:hypothetical protein D3C71_1654250 [compost metagenome]